ncbi:hypothetical protein K3495_g9479 [Podosphaera aphanis]|nr:hypothetical protein K3495_g9479 [Podosphaera aphanis]
MSFEISVPKKQSRKQITRDHCIEIRTLRGFGLTLKDIPNELGFTMWQVQRACSRNDENPIPRKGRSSILSTEQIDLEAFVRKSPETRQMSYLEPAMGPFSHWGCSEQLIPNALKKRGYSRCIALKKSPLSAINKQKRFEFAQSQSQLDWSEEQWS